MSENNLSNRIVNISSKIKFNEKLQLELLNKKIRNSTYNPHVFSGLICRYKRPKVTITLFNSGYGILTATTSIAKSKAAVDMICKRLKKINHNLCVIEFQILTIVKAGDFERKINIEETLNCFNNVNKINDFKYDNKFLFPSFEPELFPAIIIKFKNRKWCLTLFRTGKYFITGLKNKYHFFNILRILRKYIVFK